MNFPGNHDLYQQIIYLKNIFNGLSYLIIFVQAWKQVLYSAEHYVNRKIRVCCYKCFVYFRYCKPAVQGFFKSISLSAGSSLQDTLRLLTLWFEYGQWQEVYDALSEGIKDIQIDNWLQVNYSYCTTQFRVYLESYCNK